MAPRSNAQTQDGAAWWKAQPPTRWLWNVRQGLSMGEHTGEPGLSSELGNVSTCSNGGGPVKRHARHTALTRLRSLPSTTRSSCNPSSCLLQYTFFPLMGHVRLLCKSQALAAWDKTKGPR